jgi:histidinol-phosphate aminotransferase
MKDRLSNQDALLLALALAVAKEAFVHDLAVIGMAPLSSRLHFFLLRVDAAAEWKHCLLEYRLLVRDCASFGLPEYIRVAVRHPRENDRLVAALEALRGELCPAVS